MGAHMNEADHGEIWDRLEDGESLTGIGRAIGRPLTTVRDFVTRNGGRRPEPPAEWSERRLSLADREEISRGLAVGESFRVIARQIGRAPSTVSREVKVNGGRDRYRAVDGEAGVRERAKRPKATRLEQHDKLREMVEAKLEKFWSPEQVSAWLAKTHVGDAAMQVSHEAIYLGLYAGVVEVKPKRCLRTGRSIRRRRNRRRNHGQGKIKDPVMISQRPAHVEDRVEPGHWESQCCCQAVFGCGGGVLVQVR